MPLRVKRGKLEWRFQVAGHTYSAVTGLADTKKNRVAAMQMEAEARRKVLDGCATELAIRPEPFTNAAEQFCQWADGEYRAHPASAKRLRTSMTSLKAFFGRRPVTSINDGDIEDYKTWRIREKIADVTLRHDLHALRVFKRYALKKGWCHRNFMDTVEIPSDADAMRDFVLTVPEESRLFAAIDGMIAENLAKRRTRRVTGLRDMGDLATLMLNQGCRPEELRELPQYQVDLDQGKFTIAKGKSKAARRVLPMTLISRFILENRLAEPGQWVFPSRGASKSGHMGQHQRLWNEITKRAKLDGLVIYDLRHTFATRAIEGGMNPMELVAVMGHANLRSIMRYVHLKQSHIDDGMRRFEAARASSGPVETGKKGDLEGSSGKSGDDLSGRKIN